MPYCWPHAGPASWSTTWAGRWAVWARMPTWPPGGHGDRRGRGRGRRRRQRRVHPRGRRVAHRHGRRAVRADRHPGQQRRHHPMGRPPRGRRGQPRQPPRRPCDRLVQHRPGGLAPHGRTGLRPHRDDHVLGTVRPAGQPLVRHGQGCGDRTHPQPGHRRCPARHQGQSHRPRRLHPDGRPAPRRGSTDGAPVPDVARTGRAHGRLPGPRGLPGQRRDLRRRLRPVRPHLHRLHRGLRPPRRRSRPSRTSPGTGRPSTTRRGYYVPTDLMAWSAAFMAHLAPSGGDPVDPWRRRPLAGRSARPAVDLSLNESEQDLVDLCRSFAQREIATRAPQAWEEARCPTDLLREMGQLGLLGHAHPRGVGRDRHVHGRLRRRHGADRPGRPVGGRGLAGARHHRLAAPATCSATTPSGSAGCDRWPRVGCSAPSGSPSPTPDPTPAASAPGPSARTAAG